MTTKNQARAQRLLPNGVPRWVRCYDNGGETADRYTAVFSKKSDNGWFSYRGMSEHPYHPQGVGMSGQNQFSPVDTIGGLWPPAIGRRNHLGKRILFSDLPADCQRPVVDDYKAIWQLT